MNRHVVRTEGVCELGISENAHHLDEIHVALVGKDFEEIVQPASDVAHVDLVNLPLLAEVPRDGKNLGPRVFQAFTNGSETEL